MSRHDRPLSSRELLERIGRSGDTTNDLLGDDLAGDLGAALVARCAADHMPHRCTIGDLVTWKPGLKNRRLPRHGQPAVVMAVVDPPVTDRDPDPGSTDFNELLDVVSGLYPDAGPARGERLTWHLAGRRFQPWN